jgi:predicted N-acetyltransferase YhbS
MRTERGCAYAVTAAFERDDEASLVDALREAGDAAIALVPEEQSAAA